MGCGIERAIAFAWIVAAAALPALSAPGQQDRPAPAAQPEPARKPADAKPSLASVESEARAADELMQGARFEEALTRIESIRRKLGALEGDAARRLRARTEVMAATAYVALDREDAARECFRRALAAEPALDLDPATTAPKVLRVFRSVREEPRVTR